MGHGPQRGAVSRTPVVNPRFLPLRTNSFLAKSASCRNDSAAPIDIHSRQGWWSSQCAPAPLRRLASLTGGPPADSRAERACQWESVHRRVPWTTQHVVGVDRKANAVDCGWRAPHPPVGNHRMSPPNGSHPRQAVLPGIPCLDHPWDVFLFGNVLDNQTPKPIVTSAESRTAHCLDHRYIDLRQGNGHLGWKKSLRPTLQWASGPEE